MERGIAELEFDEFERLLGEIPNALTSGREKSALTSSSKNFKRVSMDNSLSSERPMPICVNSSKGVLCEKLQNNVTLNEDKSPVNENQQSSTKRVPSNVSYLQPDDQFLTSAFSELSFNEVVMLKSANSPFQNHTVSLNGHYPHSSKKFPSNRDSWVSPNNSDSGFCVLDVKRNSQESSNFYKLDVQELKKQQTGYCQPVESFSGAMPLTNGVQGFQFLPNMPIHGVEFPRLSDQQQYFLDTQSPLPYLHSQQLSQPHIAWRHMNEEQFYNMHQQYMYLQQFRNRHLENQNPVQANGNVTARLARQNLRQPYNEMPFPHGLEESDQEPCWNKVPFSKCINRSGPIRSSTDFNTVPVLEKIGEQIFPEKILTRSHGLNSLRSVKFGSFVGTELLANANQNERPFLDGNFHQNLAILNSRCLFPDTTDLKYNDLRAPHQKYHSTDEIAGGIYLMAKDQHGCRFLQRKFTEGTLEDIEKIFLEIIVHIVELMTDPFGNYLVQKLLEVCDEDQRLQILHTITRKSGDLVRVSCDMHGTRAVQKVIETLKTPEQFSVVVSSLKPGIVTLIKDMNGNHVAQRCLQYLKPEYSEFLFEAAIANCVELATDRHGCCVLQKCLSHSDSEQRHRLISEITSNALILSQDPFGNYVVQFVFEIHVPWATTDILDQLEGNYGDLSMQKYGSNVVEKCLKYAGEERRTCIIQELMSNPRLDQIMQDPYGNYVIQASLNHSKGGLHAALVETIRPHIPVLRTSPFGKKVLSSITLKK